MPKAQNTFGEGLNMDVSDYLIRNSMMRNCKNMRLLDLDGTSYAVTTIRGTEHKFNLSTNFIPIASVEYGDVLYILSGTLPITGNKFETFELGSFNSPIYPIGGEKNPEEYAAFNNLDDGPFTGIIFWDIYLGDFVDMSVQPSYDGSVDIIITVENNPPRIINSKFDKEFNITERREGANTNDYTSGSVDTETRLILRSQKIMNIDFGAIENGGKLQAGNYVYVFRYMTADFNETDVVNQSGLCSVFEGYETTKYTTSVNQETTKRVRLALSNVDTDFAYFKVYFQFSTGENSVDKRTFEFVQPVAISGRTTFDFIHDAYEQTEEIASEAINLDFTAFDSATSNTQANGYLLLGGVKQADIDYQEFATAAQTVTINSTSLILGINSPHENPENIYKYLGYFSGESYAFGIVFILLDGSLTPVFPVKGYDQYNWDNLTAQQQEDIEKKGIYRFRTIEQSPFHTILGTFSKGVNFNVGNITQSIKDKTLGVFFVRAERKRDLVSQGIVIPTIRVPAIDFTRDPQIDNIDGMGDYYGNFTQESDYKNFPIIDNLVEPWAMFDDNEGDNDKKVIKRDGTNRLADGYMPSVIKNFNISLDSGTVKVKDHTAWAYLSADYILNESRYITALQRSNMGFSQWSEVKLKAVIEGKVANKWKQAGTYNVDTSLLYDFVQYVDNFNGITNKSELEDIVYVPPASFATGHDFVSGMSVRFRTDVLRTFQVRSLVDAYFGLRAEVFGSILDGSPYNQPDDTVHTFTTAYHTDGPAYDNIDTIKNRAYLISIYPRPSGEPIDDINHLYDTVDGLSYHQISDRISWINIGSDIDVYGGDCYTGKVYKRLNISGYDDPKTPSEVLVEPAGYHSDLSGDNINQGIVVSFIQECEYNPALRLPYLFDTSDPEKRTSYPFRDSGDYNDFRTYRLHETNKTNQGHDETERPKNHLTLPSNVPYIASNFFTRVVHSEKHVPNAFQNGYRSFMGVNYEDYDPAMGEIVRLFTHRDQLFIIFEHGIGLGPVNQRIQTGADTAGAIYVEPSGVLPPTLSYASRKIGAQHGNALIQTPSAIYGMDKSRRKIWQFRDGLLMISDMGFQSFLDKLLPEALDTPRFGYDPNYHEVIFTVDGWTLCFKEGLERFTSFYSYKGAHYAHRAKEFYSFNDGIKQFDIHNATVRTIYGNVEKSYIEFVVNPSANMAKVYDFLNIMSNELPPISVDLYTYNIDTHKDDVLDETKMYQHVQITEGVDMFTEEERIRLRDRKFVVQVPNVTYINDMYWGKGRFRDKYVIIRLTYETDQKVELISMITDYRFSMS